MARDGFQKRLEFIQINGSTEDEAAENGNGKTAISF